MNMVKLDNKELSFVNGGMCNRFFKFAVDKKITKEEIIYLIKNPVGKPFGSASCLKQYGCTDEEIRNGYKVDDNGYIIEIDTSFSDLIREVEIMFQFLDLQEKCN